MDDDGGESASSHCASQTDDGDGNASPHCVFALWKVTLRSRNDVPTGGCVFALRYRRGDVHASSTCGAAARALRIADPTGCASVAACSLGRSHLANQLANYVIDHDGHPREREYLLAWGNALSYVRIPPPATDLYKAAPARHADTSLRSIRPGGWLRSRKRPKVRERRKTQPKANKRPPSTLA